MNGSVGARPVGLHAAVGHRERAGVVIEQVEREVVADQARTTDGADDGSEASHPEQATALVVVNPTSQHKLTRFSARYARRQVGRFPRLPTARTHHTSLFVDSTQRSGQSDSQTQTFRITKNGS
jgi:hypothetical protein